MLKLIIDEELVAVIEADGEKTAAFLGLSDELRAAYLAGVSAGAGSLIHKLRKLGVFRRVTIGAGGSRYYRYQIGS